MGSCNNGFIISEAWVAHMAERCHVVDLTSGMCYVICSQRYYLSHNTALVKLLKRLGHRSVPQWLKDDLSDTVTA
jgi:hypothetical protein